MNAAAGLARGVIVQELLGRLGAVDASAAGALRAITYFDALIDGRASVDAFLRGAAALCGCPVGLCDTRRRVITRVSPEGHRLPRQDPDPSWPTAELGDRHPGAVWVERDGEPLYSDALILERLVVGLGITFDRTRSPGADLTDPASVEILIDHASAIEDRERAASRIGLSPTATVCVVALLEDDAVGSERRAGPEPREAGAAPPVRWGARVGRVLVRLSHSTGPTSAVVPRHCRSGTGPAMPVTGLPASYDGALAALRLTAAGTREEPGPRHLRYEDLGGLAMLAVGTAASQAELVPDVRSLAALEQEVPGSLAILDVVARCESLRQASAELHFHHSTLQARMPRIETALGYQPTTPSGRVRLTMALALRRIGLNGDLP